MYRAAIFDMDGLLIDSEPHWQAAEVAVLGRLGVPLTTEMCFQTVGLRLDEAMAYWYARYPWQGRDLPDVCTDVLAGVCSSVAECGEPMPGALELVRRLRAQGIPVAVATSSGPELIAVVLERLGLADAVDVVRSALDQPWGKPHPAVFMAAAEALQVPAVNCIAFEDSVNGVISAKAARMYCVAVPHSLWSADPRFIVADEVLSSLDKCDQDWVAARFGV